MVSKGRAWRRHTNQIETLDYNEFEANLFHLGRVVYDYDTIEWFVTYNNHSYHWDSWLKSKISPAKYREQNMFWLLLVTYQNIKKFKNIDLLNISCIELIEMTENAFGFNRFKIDRMIMILPGEYIDNAVNTRRVPIMRTSDVIKDLLAQNEIDAIIKESLNHELISFVEIKFETEVSAKHEFNRPVFKFNNQVKLYNFALLY